MRLPVFLLSAFALFFLTCRSDGQGETPPELTETTVEGDTARRIDRYLSQLEEQGFSGVALVAVDDRILLNKGYGLADDSLALPVTPATVFGAGSITKQFTGAAILKLEMQEKLRTGDPLSDYLPGIPPDKQSITLHHLLTHSAGFPGAIGDDYESIGREAYIERAMATPLQSEPGTAYAYSNVGYSLLAAVVEKVSGQSYETFLREHLFLPAGMDHTGYVLPDWQPEKIATGYRGDRRWGKLNEKNWAKDGPYWHLRGNGGILSTPGDMYRWHRALLDDDILSVEAKAKYYARHIEEGEGAGTYYGYGWAIFPTPRGGDLITHNGGNGIFFADILRYLEEDVFIFFATNRSHRIVNRSAFEIAQMVFQPDYNPEAPSLAGKVLAGLPDDERGVTTQALLAAIRSGQKEDVRRFFNEHVARGLLEMMPMERHLEMFQQLRADFGEAELTRILERDGRLELRMRPPAGGEVTLVIGFSSEEKGKMTGLGVEG